METSLAGSVFNSGLDLHFCSAVGVFFSSLCAPLPLFSQSSPSFLNCPYQNWVVHCDWQNVAFQSRCPGLAREVGAGRKVRPEATRRHADVTTPALAPHLPQDDFEGSLQVPTYPKGSAGAQFCSSDRWPTISRPRSRGEN